MSVDELWNLHEQLREVLATKLDDEMHEVQRRMAEIDAKTRRPYPKVHPKYRNPERPSETWSGRGLQPHWVRAQLRKGKKFDDLLISRSHLINARPDVFLRGAPAARGPRHAGCGRHPRASRYPSKLFPKLMNG